MIGEPGGVAPRRYLIATAVSAYRDPAWNIPGLDDARRQIVELFTGRLGYEHVSTLGLNPTREQLPAAIRAFCRAADRRPDDLLAVYVTGHGRVLDDARHVLLPADTDPDDVEFSALPTAELARVMLTKTGIRRILLMLDVCYAEQGGNLLAAKALESMDASWAQEAGSGLVIMSAARPHQPAQAGLFPRLLAEAVQALPVAGHGPPHLAVEALVAQMNAHPDRPPWQQLGCSMLGLVGHVPPFFTNPRHDRGLTGVDLAIQRAVEFENQDRARDTTFEGTMLPRAMAYPDAAKPGWWFTGRAAALAEVSHWLHGADPVRVVTAGPGSGKSAVLGLIAALTHGIRRPMVPATTLGLRSDQFPADSVDVVVYAQHMTNAEVIEALAAAARVSADSVGALVTELKRLNRPRPFTAIIDGLDEAATPESLCTDVLRHLVRHACGHLRLLLGTRPYLVERLGAKPGETVDLDSERYADPEALQAYTARMLFESRPGSPYRLAAAGVVLGVATAVAEAAGTSFLVARIVSGTLAAAEQVVANPQDPEWRRSLPRYADQAMVDDLERRLGADAVRATNLLRPLAFAQGEGLPWENLWAPLASAMSGHDYTDDDLLWLRRTAGSYVVETMDQGRSAYRLYHQALAEHLSNGADEPTVHRAFVETLVGSVPYRADATRDWGRAHPYALHHLALHAARAGRLDEVLEDSEYLVHAVPSGLVAHLRHIAGEAARSTASVYRSHLNIHAYLEPPARRQILALAAAEEGADLLRRRLVDRIPAGGWAVRWTSGTATFSSALRDVLADGAEFTLAVACTTIDDVPIAVTVSFGWIRLWNLRTGLQHCEPIAHGVIDASSTICTVVDGDPVLIAGGIYGTQAWNLRNRQSFGCPIDGGHRRIRALTCGEVDTTPVALAVSDDYSLHVWDLHTGGPHQPPITLPESFTTKIAYTNINGIPAAVVATDGALLTVNLRTGLPMNRIAQSFDHSELNLPSTFFDLACAMIDDIPVAVTAGTRGLHVWDLRTGTIHKTLEPISDPPVVFVTPLHIGDNPAAVAVTLDGQMTLWDVRTGTRRGDAVMSGARSIRSVTSATVDGTPLTITLDDSRGTGQTARAWNIEPGQSHSAGSITTDYNFLTARFGESDGVTKILIRGQHGLRIWNADTGESHAVSDLDSASGITGLATLEDNPIAIAFAHSIMTRDLPHRLLGTPGRIESLAGLELEEGSVLLAAVANGGLWRLRSGPYDEQLITDDVDGFGNVVCIHVNGEPVAVVAGFGVRPQAWNLRTGDLHAVANVGRVDTLSCAQVEGSAVAVLAGPSDVHLWDLATGDVHPVATLPDRITTNSVTCSLLNGTALATTAHKDGVRIWNLKARKLVDWIPLPNPVNATLTLRGDLVIVLQYGVSVFRRRS